MALLSIVPGAWHGWSGKVLRWPILAVTYLIITVELAVYVCIQCIIRIAEWAIAYPNHQQLQRAMAQAQSYEEWYTHAMTFHQSQNVMCGFMIIVNISRTAPIPLAPTTSTTKSQCSRTAPIPLVPTTSTTKSQCIITIGDLLRNSCANCKRHDNQSRRRHRPRVNKRILVPATPRRCKVKFIEPWL